MELFLNGTGKSGTGQVPFTRKNLSEPFHFFRSCKRAFRLKRRVLTRQEKLVLTHHKIGPDLIVCIETVNFSRGHRRNVDSVSLPNLSDEFFDDSADQFLLSDKRALWPRKN